jgi:uncharacterized NAD-dependent epimerase/dehydratase family protein
MLQNAVILTAGLLTDIHAKTAHGLIRESERFRIVGIIDHNNVGKDAGEVLDGVNRNIPIFASIKEFRQESEEPADFCIIGVATKGGVIPEEFRPVIKEALDTRMGIVNGLHEYVGDDPEFAELARKHEVEIIDVRRPRKATDLKFWTGEIQEVNAAKIPVLGTDCAMGKRTTAMFLRNMLREKDYNAHMVYTGQTGWMLGNKYGFIFDSTPNDFVSGELEEAILQCYKNENPDVILYEGQSGLRNPSGPCGSEFIISGKADGVILIHDPVRPKFKGMEGYIDDMPSPKEEIDLIRVLGAPTIGLALNTAKIDYEEAKKWQTKYEDELGIPVALPMEEGVGKLYDVVVKEIEKYK